MPTKIVRHEIYDENGLMSFHEYEVEDNIEQDIIEKEQQLLDMYIELQELKSRLENNL
jgi:hypothetical protein